MPDKFSLTNSTTVSVSLVISLLTLAFFMGVLWTRVSETASAVDQLSSSMDRSIDSNNKTQTDIVALGGRLDNLNTRLDDLARRLDGINTQSSVTVRPARSNSQVVIVPTSSGNEPQPNENPPQNPPSNAPPPSEEPPPGQQPPEPEPQPTLLGKVLQPAMDLLAVIGS